MSDDDPAGITTYAVLGAEYGYRLLWVLAASTVALVVFHELGARLGVVTGRGLMDLVRERFGVRGAALGAAALVIANTGTMCAELAGVAAGGQLLFGLSAAATVPLACILLAFLVLRSSFHRVEHVLLALTAIFVAYVISGVMAHPDWSAAAEGLVPSLPGDRNAVYLAVATLGTTLAPWGLTFIQSYAVDKGIPPEHLAFERIDVLVGSILTGVIGAFVVMASAETLHASGQPVHDATDLARGLEPLAGSLAPVVFGIGFLGAALLAGAVVPLATAFSVSEAAGRKADINATVSEEPLFYGVFLGIMAVAAAIVLIPGAPLVTILVSTQVLNAVLLLAVVPFLVLLAADRRLMGRHALTGPRLIVTWAVFAMIAASIIALLVLTVT